MHKWLIQNLLDDNRMEGSRRTRPVTNSHLDPNKDDEYTLDEEDATIYHIIVDRLSYIKIKSSAD